MRYFISVWMDRVEIEWRTVYVTRDRERAIAAYELIRKYTSGNFTLQLTAVSDNSITTLLPEGW